MPILPMDELIPTRATLLERLKNWQDQSSWQDFFDTYWRLIYTVARKGGLNDVEAREVVQETMLAVARQMPRFQYDPAIGSFKAWLLNQTRWRMRDELRKRTPHLDAGAYGADPDTSTRVVDKVADPVSLNLDEVWEDEWERNLLDIALTRVKRRLAPKHFQMFDLHMNKHWPPAKVAKAFGVPVSQVYTTKHRVMDLIKAEIRKVEAPKT